MRVAVANALCGPPGDLSVRLVVDLAEVVTALFDPGSGRIDELLGEVAGSDVVIVASPTYEATYTGLLKAFLDRCANEGLAHTVAVAVMTGAAPIHALAPEVHLRPLLVELGASVPARALYVTEQQFDDLDAVIGRGPPPPGRSSCGPCRRLTPRLSTRFTPATAVRVRGWRRPAVARRAPRLDVPRA